MKTIERVKAASSRPAARNGKETTSYTTSNRTARRKSLERAADALLVLEMSMSDRERAGLSALLEHRLRRAYGGAVL